MVKYYETQTMELKEKYTDSIAKEIVSFLNSDGGTLIVGVKDDGTVVGVDKLDETLRKISDVITRQIEPNPQDEITTEVRFDEKKALIVLNISKEFAIFIVKKNMVFRQMVVSFELEPHVKK